MHTCMDNIEIIKPIFQMNITDSFFITFVIRGMLIRPCSKDEYMSEWVST